MKRGGELKRTKPLARKTALATSPLSRSRLHADQADRRQLPKSVRRNTGPPKLVLRLLAARSEGLCEFWQCLDDAAHTHHRRPRRMGGSTAVDTNLASNLLRFCPDHHGWVESSRLKSLELGLLLHATADPLRAPVLLRYGSVLLGNDGTWIDLTTNLAEEATHV